MAKKCSAADKKKKRERSTGRIALRAGDGASHAESGKARRISVVDSEHLQAPAVGSKGGDEIAGQNAR